MFDLPDPITGLLTAHSKSKNYAIWVHVFVYTFSSFLVTFGTTANAWYFQVHDIKTSIFLGFLNGCIISGGVMLKVWRSNSPKWLKEPEDEKKVQT